MCRDKNQNGPLPKARSAVVSSSDLTVWICAWGELFVLLPLHAFWVLYKATPFVAENTASALVAAVPFGAIVVLGLAMGVRSVRAAFVGIERWLHLTAAVLLTVVLLYVAVRDPLAPVFPITWPLCFWSIAVSFATAADLATHQRARTTAAVFQSGRYRWVGTIGLGIAIWAALVWIASGETWLPYFLTVSAVFHAVIAAVGGNGREVACEEAIQGGGRPGRVTAFVETLFAIALILTALMRFLFTCSLTGTAELKYFQFVDIAVTPWFVFGAVLAVLATRFRFALLTHAAAVGVVLLAGASATWPVSFPIGYALPVLCFASAREGAFAYAISASVSAVAVMFGLFAFLFAGLVIVHKVGLGFSEDLLAAMRFVVPSLYVVWLGVGGGEPSLVQDASSAERGRGEAAVEPREAVRVRRNVACYPGSGGIPGRTGDVAADLV